MQRSLEDTADGDASEVVRVVEIRYENLQRRFGIAGSRRNGRHDGLEQRLQVFTRFIQIKSRGTCLGYGIQHGKIELRFLCVEIDEKS